MALPIKPSDTQEGCNPISSNCVIWQGPDIPCISLCNGDSVSDVVAKLAERLCTIADQLDISLLDLSCFNPIFPTPQNFRDVVQLIINKVCALENPTVDPNAPTTTSCPDDCIVTIATCFQETDFLGNLITTLPLKDYVIKIGNEVCSILSVINTIQTAVDNLRTDVDYILANCCSQSVPEILITTSNCIGKGTTVPIQTFVVSLEAAFCDLNTLVGGANIPGVLASVCLSDSDNQLDQLPATVPYSSIPGWNSGASNLALSLENLYLAFCDLRSYALDRITTLEADLAACCAPSCNDYNWSMFGTGVRAQKIIDLFFTGSIPSGFDYCTGSTVSVEVSNFDTPSTTSIFNEDVISNINTGATLSLDVSAAAVTEYSIGYNIYISLCVTDGTISCTKERTVTVYNANWSTDRGFAISSANIAPGTGNITLSYLNLAFVTSAITTTFSAQLYTSSGTAVGAAVTLSGTSYTWAGPYTTGATYYVVVTTTQGTESITYTSSVIPVA